MKCGGLPDGLNRQRRGVAGGDLLVEFGDDLSVGSAKKTGAIGFDEVIARSA